MTRLNDQSDLDKLETSGAAITLSFFQAKIH